jgi:cation diffusion facilitator CzcD-associated flavoprotein CzcO
MIKKTVFDVTEKLWTVEIQNTETKETATIMCKHLVQATGLSSGKPYLPQIKDEYLYQGLRIHSTQYHNAEELKEKGIKVCHSPKPHLHVHRQLLKTIQTVVVVGSANTAFDIMRDCWEAGLSTTMIARSPTYIFPYDYVMDPHGVGAYDLMPLEAADRLFNTFPSMLDGQFSHGLFAHLASQEP